MQVKRDFEILFDEKTYIDYHGDRFARLLENPRTQAKFVSALAEAAEVCRPAACYDSFPIEKFMHDRLLLAGGVRIGGGPVTQVVGGAEELVVAVCTVGPAVDARIKAYHSEKERFKMMILDELASWAVDQVRLQMVVHLAGEFGAQGWRTSTCLSPGESSWSVSEQEIIFKLLDTAPIGVSLNESCVMSPLKSLSLIVGAGPKPMGVEGLSNCDFCSLKDRCRYSRQHV